MASKNEMTIHTDDGEMKISVVNITPKKATELLSLNVNNRTLRPDRVNVYSAEMVAGNWKSNGIPIIIGNDGELKDGQHRLRACVKSGKTMKNVIVIHLPQNQTNCYDIGAPRTPKDIARFMGLGDISFLRSNNMYAAINAAMCGTTYKNKIPSKVGLVLEMQKHSDACNFVNTRLYNLGLSQSIKIRKSGIGGAIINAFLNGYDHEKLTRFCEVLADGICKDDTEVPIIRLRDEAMNVKSKSREDRIQMYLMTQASLKAYIDGKTSVDFKKANEEYYTYPE